MIFNKFVQHIFQALASEDTSTTHLQPKHLETSFATIDVDTNAH